MILSIETATQVCSVALHENGQLLGVQTLHFEKSHSSMLATMIKNVLSDCGITFKNLAAVAISEGPGSYTGLRIGTSSAKGLCFSLDIPLIAVSTLEAMAFGLTRYNIHKALLCPMLDARRMEVYSQVFDHNLNVVQSIEPKIIDEYAYSDLLEENQLLFFGNGAAKCASIITHSNAHFIEGVHPDATNVGALASMKYDNQQFEDVAYFEPFYLKEVNITKPKVRT